MGCLPKAATLKKSAGFCRLDQDHVVSRARLGYMAKYRRIQSPSHRMNDGARPAYHRRTVRGSDQEGGARNREGTSGMPEYGSISVIE